MVLCTKHWVEADRQANELLVTIDDDDDELATTLVNIEVKLRHSAPELTPFHWYLNLFSMRIYWLEEYGFGRSNAIGFLCLGSNMILASSTNLLPTFKETRSAFCFSNLQLSSATRRRHAAMQIAREQKCVESEVRVCMLASHFLPSLWVNWSISPWLNDAHHHDSWWGWWGGWLWRWRRELKLGAQRDC